MLSTSALLVLGLSKRQAASHASTKLWLVAVQPLESWSVPPCHAHAKLLHCLSCDPPLTVVSGSGWEPPAMGVAEHRWGGRSRGCQEAVRRRHPPRAPALGQRRHCLAEEGGSFLSTAGWGFGVCCRPASSSTSKLWLPLVLARLCTSFCQHPSVPISVSLLCPARSLTSWGAEAVSPINLLGQRQAGEFWQ